MANYVLEVEIDEGVLLAEAGDFSPDQVIEAIYAEMGWVRDSGIYLMDVRRKEAE
jgi:hypothetical protein